MIKDFICFDFETSGLNFRTDQIIEACVVSVKNGEIGTIFNTMVQPRDAEFVLNPKITELTGHTIRDMQTGISEADLCELLWHLLRGPHDMPLLVAHNALFDMSFLDSLWARFIPGYEEYVTNPFIDTLTIARDRLPWPHKLVPVCAKYGIDIDQAHSAFDDTMALAQLVLKMEDDDEQWIRSGNKAVQDYINLAGYKRKYGEPDWVPSHATLYPQGYTTETINTKPRKTQAPKYTPVVTAPPKRVPGPPVVSTGGQRRNGTEGVDESMNDMLPLNPLLQGALDALLDGAVYAGDSGNFPAEFPSVWVEAHYFDACMYYLADKGSTKREDFAVYDKGDGNIIIEYIAWKGDK